MQPRQRQFSSVREALKRWYAPKLGLLRAASYLFFVAVCVLLYGVHAARAALSERSLGVGRELERLHATLGSTKTLVLNGQRMLLSSAVVSQDVQSVLNQVAELCRQQPNALARAVDRVLAPYPAAHAASTNTADLRRLAILRNQHAEDGIVACITSRSETPPPLSELVGHLTQSLDLGVLGDFVYTYARSAKTKERVQTHVITVWTSGSFRPADMFPATGDAPGTDSTLVGRPARSRRILTSVAVDAPYALRVYESELPLSGALAQLEQGMGPRGFTRLLPSGLAPNTRFYQHLSGVSLLFTINESQGSQRRVISVVEMGAASSR